MSKISFSLKNFIPKPLIIPAQAYAAPLSSDSFVPFLIISNYWLKIYNVLSSKNLDNFGIHLHKDLFTSSDPPLDLLLIKS